MIFRNAAYLLSKILFTPPESKTLKWFNFKSNPTTEFRIVYDGLFSVFASSTYISEIWETESFRKPVRSSVILF